MALTTYDEVKSAIAGWLSRDDLTARIPDFITLLEARVNRMLRTPDMEFRVTTTTISGDPFIALPTGYRGMRVMRITSTNPPTPLSYMTPQTIDSKVMAGETARPRVFTTQGNELRLAPTPDAAYTLEMTYFRGVPALTGAANWLLTDHPDIYIHGPCVEAQVFIQRDQRVATFESVFQQRMEEVKAEAKRTRHSAGPLVSHPEFSTP